jgi:putative membrane protein
VSTSPPDPRSYLAAERTMLAWLRTGIAVMGFGFVVARFGLFLRLMEAQTGVASARTLSPYLGAGLVALGVVATVGGAIQYHRYVRALPTEERERFANARFVLFLSVSLVALGTILGIELMR